MALSTYPRAHLEKVIREGGSVLHAGTLITRVEDLPSEAVLAEGDPAAERQALDVLDTQMLALAEQKNRLAQQQKERKEREAKEAEQAKQQQEADEKARAATAAEKDKGAEKGVDKGADKGTDKGGDEAKGKQFGQRAATEGKVGQNKFPAPADAGKGDKGKE